MSPGRLLRVAADLAASKVALEAFGALVAGFAPPYGSFTERVRDLAMRSYAAFRTVNGAVQRTPYRAHDLAAIDAAYDLPLARIESYLDETERVPGGWLILVFHRAAVLPTDRASTFITPEKSQELLDLLKARRVVIKPVGEGLGLWTAPSAAAVVTSKWFDSSPEVEMAARRSGSGRGSQRR